MIVFLSIVDFWGLYIYNIQQMNALKVNNNAPFLQKNLFALNSEAVIITE